MSTLADSLTERLRRALPADQAYTPADWDVDVMPGAVRHYLQYLLRHHRRREARRLRRARSDWVHYDHPEMEQATRTYLDAVADHMRVPSADWPDTLQTAVRRVTDYLVRPVPALRAFVFEDSSEPVPVATIETRMRFFKPYAYLRNAVEAYAEKRDQDAFEPDGFEHFLRRVDERMTEDFDPDRWLRLIDPLLETAQCATGREAIPLPLLRTFFEEKNASRIADRLTAHEHEQNADTIGPAALRRLLATAAEESSSNPDGKTPAVQDDSLWSSDRPDAADGPSAPDLAGSPPDADESPDAGESADPRPDGATPMWKQFEQGRARRGGEGTATTDDEGAKPLWAQFRAQPSSAEASSGASSSRTPTEPAADSSSDPSLSALEDEVFAAEHPPNRSVYVRELFGGNGDAYRQILERLRTTESWSTASQIIASDVFRENEVNIYSDAAVHFTNAVEAGYKE